MWTWAEVQSVHVLEDFQTEGHRIFVLGRDGERRRCFLGADGEWHPITEMYAHGGDGPSVGHHPDGIYLPRGVLDAIVAKHTRTTAPEAATERHLEDAMAIRDRLLALVEKGKR